MRRVYRTLLSSSQLKLPFNANDIDVNRLRHSYWDFGSPFLDLSIGETDEGGFGDTPEHAEATDRARLDDEFLRYAFVLEEHSW